MIPALPLFHNIAGRPVIVLGGGEAAEAKRRLVERAGGRVADEADREARLAFVALDEPEEAAARLRARGVLVNVPDRPELCDFAVPSILDRSPVLVAVGSGGASAGLAKALRLRLESLLPQGLGRLAEGLRMARPQLRERLPDNSERRRALDSALAEGGALDPLDEASAGRLDTWIGGNLTRHPLSLVEITLTSDDPDDLTLRQARLLGSADTIAYETGVSASILARARADASRIELLQGASPGSLAGSSIVLRRPPGENS